MKRLITLIFSAALLSPMWAGAQTTTTPSIQGQLHYSGNITAIGASYSLLNPAYSMLCPRITDLRLNIQSPNNASPVKSVSGYFSCSGGAWAPFYGTLVATINRLPNNTNADTTNYTGVFTLGLTQMNCYFLADLSSAICDLYASNGRDLTPVGSGIFNHTDAP
jgi:hypothetical protein